MPDSALLLSRLGTLWPFVLGVAFAYLLTGALAGSASIPVSQPGTMQGAKAKQSPGDQVDVILEHNVLGLDNPRPAAQGSSTPDPEAWKVLGIFAGQQRMALLQIKGETVTVQQGQTIKGWLLQDVSANRLLFTSGRDQCVLTIFNDKPAAELVQGERNTVRLSKAEVQGVLNDPNALLKQALYKPSKRNGKVEGFRITNIQDDSLLEQAGLEDGDVLVRVNGQTIDGPAKMMQVYTGLQSSKAVTMNIRRGGELLTLVVEVE
jgi:general secretion pathway protein C